MPSESPATLALSDGTVVTGCAIGQCGTTRGELCFNTSMTGYQEILTDPSYYGQLVMMTYPHIGNYGTTPAENESHAPKASGLIVRSCTNTPSGPKGRSALDAYLAQHGVVGITDVDTRALVRQIRTDGVLNAVIDSTGLDADTLVARARNCPDMAGRAYASKVTTQYAYTYNRDNGPTVVVVDYGAKRSLLDAFAQRGCTVHVVPAATPLDKLRSYAPDALFLSNGPGDPRAMPEAIAHARSALESNLPVLGICLGHQLMALAQGMDVYKMRVGHRGANQPVKNLMSGRVEITTQNHGFAVDAGSLPDQGAVVTHRNLNDDTIEGLRYPQHKAFSLQYHPEASPGPHDSDYLFDAFLEMVPNRAPALRTARHGLAVAG
ncbi:carbamoyl phosphate synthase small subunit [Longimonas halophila]|uniref:Carbamoyl phosphate synthase small chain n=1 Tax=Longimonas halophila TaxID=1469170 RepID=A0A2H3NL15_9BACT|nr:glutamine-hydrolyzing carbamoyl-phosphate synthase small subunit [Longimonas halophila]PEN06718.1 carbamoyl phosphate synthase small subunit [Longimonas halophila]